MGGRGRPAADATQSIVMCSDVPCACIVRVFALLKCNRFFSSTIERHKRFITIVDLPGGSFQLVFLHYVPHSVAQRIA